MVLNVEKQNIHKMSTIEIRMLRWISGNTSKDMLQNEEILLKIGVAPIEKKWRRVVWDGLVMYRRAVRKSELI